MASNLARSTLDLIHDMLVSGELTTSQMAEAAGCSKRAIIRLRSNLQLLGSIKAPRIKGMDSVSGTGTTVKFVLFARNIPDRSGRAENNSDRSSPMEQHIFWRRLHFTSLLRKAKNTSDIQSTIIYLRSVFRVSACVIRVYCCN
jgi:hypothetical protein